jgi:hypothetical protein
LIVDRRTALQPMGSIAGSTKPLSQISLDSSPPPRRYGARTVSRPSARPTAPPFRARPITHLHPALLKSDAWPSGDATTRTAKKITTFYIDEGAPTGGHLRLTASASTSDDARARRHGWMDGWIGTLLHPPSPAVAPTLSTPAEPGWTASRFFLSPCTKIGWPTTTIRFFAWIDFPYGSDGTRRLVAIDSRNSPQSWLASSSCWMTPRTDYT